MNNTEFLNRLEGQRQELATIIYNYGRLFSEELLLFATKAESEMGFMVGEFQNLGVVPPDAESGLLILDEMIDEIHMSITNMLGKQSGLSA